MSDIEAVYRAALAVELPELKIETSAYQMMRLLAARAEDMLPYLQWNNREADAMYSDLRKLIEEARQIESPNTGKQGRPVAVALLAALRGELGYQWSARFRSQLHHYDGTPSSDTMESLEHAAAIRRIAEGIHRAIGGTG